MLPIVLQRAGVPGLTHSLGRLVLLFLSTVVVYIVVFVFEHCAQPDAGCVIIKVLTQVGNFQAGYGLVC